MQPFSFIGCAGMTGLMVALGAYLAADLIEDLIAGDDNSSNGGGGRGGGGGGSGTKKARAFNFSSPIKEDQQQ